MSASAPVLVPASLSDLARIHAAARFAAERHADQRRKDPRRQPYINHLIEVAYLLASAVGETDANLVIAGYLHDSIEDVGVTHDELVGHFGADVATLVSEVTDDKSLSREERKRLQIEHAATISRRGQWLKMADKISNVRSMVETPPAEWTPERRLDYIMWAGRVVAAMPEPHPYLQREFGLVYERALKVS